MEPEMFEPKSDFKYIIEEDPSIDDDLKDVRADQITNMVVDQDTGTTEGPEEKMHGAEIFDVEDSGPKLIIDMSNGTVDKNADNEPETIKTDKGPENTVVEKVLPAVSGANKRKRTMDSVLLNILKNKALSVKDDEKDSADEEEAIPRKIARRDSNSSGNARRDSNSSGNARRDSNSSGNGFDYAESYVSDSSLDTSSSESDSGLDLRTPAKLKQVENEESTCEPSSVRKNRRKTNVPVKFEKPDMGNQNNNGGKFRLAVDRKPTYGLPMDFTPKEESSCDSTKSVKIETESAPMDLNKRNSPVDSALREDMDSPLDLSTRNTPVFNARNSPVASSSNSSVVSARNSPVASSRNIPVYNSQNNYSTLQGILNGTQGTQCPLPYIGYAVNPLMHVMNQAQVRELMETYAKMQAGQLVSQHQYAQCIHFGNLLFNNPIMFMQQSMAMNINNQNCNAVKKEVKQESPSVDDSANNNLCNNVMNQNNRMASNLEPAVGGPGPSVAGPGPAVEGPGPAVRGPAVAGPSNHLPLEGTPGRRSKNSPGRFIPPDKIPSLEKVPEVLELVNNNLTPQNVVEALRLRYPDRQDPSPDGTVPPFKFSVKDNDEITMIVKSLLVVSEMGANERALREEPGRYICRFCNKQHTEVLDLSRHIAGNHVAKKYKCDKCDKTFHDVGNRRQHERVHDPFDMPFHCTMCKRKFKHKCTLVVHIRAHTGEKPFECPECGVKFKISSALVSHRRIHTGELPYTCTKCEERFRCQSNLKQHLQKHLGEKKFGCDYCGKFFTRNCIRNTHIRNHCKVFKQNLLASNAQLSPTSDVSNISLAVTKDVLAITYPESPVSPQEPSDSGKTE